MTLRPLRAPVTNPTARKRRNWWEGISRRPNEAAQCRRPARLDVLSFRWSAGAGEWTQLFLRRRDALTHGGWLRNHLAVAPRFMDYGNYPCCVKHAE